MNQKSQDREQSMYSNSFSFVGGSFRYDYQQSMENNNFVEAYNSMNINQATKKQKHRYDSNYDNEANRTQQPQNPLLKTTQKYLFQQQQSSSQTRIIKQTKPITTTTKSTIQPFQKQRTSLAQPFPQNNTNNYNQHKISSIRSLMQDLDDQKRNNPLALMKKVFEGKNNRVVYRSQQQNLLQGYENHIDGNKMGLIHGNRELKNNTQNMNINMNDKPLENRFSNHRQPPNKYPYSTYKQQSKTPFNPIPPFSSLNNTIYIPSQFINTIQEQYNEQQVNDTITRHQTRLVDNFLSSYGIKKELVSHFTRIGCNFQEIKQYAIRRVLIQRHIKQYRKTAQSLEKNTSEVNYQAMLLKDPTICNAWLQFLTKDISSNPKRQTQLEKPLLILTKQKMPLNSNKKQQISHILNNQPKIKKQEQYDDIFQIVE